jgi:hypothetical protein
MIEDLKKLFGEERLARLAAMPLVKEKGGIERHLQEACTKAASPAHALVKAIQTAGGKPTAADVAMLDAKPTAPPSAVKAEALRAEKPKEKAKG